VPDVNGYRKVRMKGDGGGMGGGVRRREVNGEKGDGRKLTGRKEMKGS
jgi:hypothetical protein